MATQWYVSMAGEKTGPMSSAELSKMGIDGLITTDTLVWKHGMEGWAPATKVRGLAISSCPPAVPANLQPVPVIQVAPVTVAGHVTTERTSKNLKGHLLAFYAAFIAGIVGLAIMQTPGSSNPNPGMGIMAVVVFGAMVWLTVTKFRIWWNHG